MPDLDLSPENRIWLERTLKLICPDLSLEAQKMGALALLVDILSTYSLDIIKKHQAEASPEQVAFAKQCQKIVQEINQFQAADDIRICQAVQRIFTAVADSAVIVLICSKMLKLAEEAGMDLPQLIQSVQNGEKVLKPVLFRLQAQAPGAARPIAEVLDRLVMSEVSADTVPQ